MFNSEKYHNAVRRLQSVIRPGGAGAPAPDYMKPQHHEDRSFFLERTRAFVARAGIDCNAFAVVHVAGTSGKGSTASMIANVLHAAGAGAGLGSGAHVGLFRSPFVTTSIENIEVDGVLIHPNAFADLVDWVMPLVDAARAAEGADMSPSYAEIFFAIALRHFANVGCQYVVLETGCGGRFDYSNVVPHPRACVLTPVNLDHTDILGDTLEQIAWHKAGIIKEGAAVVSTETHPAVRAIFDAEAAANHTRVAYVQPTREYPTAMPGQHQQWNAAAAAAVGRLLGVPDTAIERGIAATRLPARVEVMQRNPLCPLVILDGAHSPAKMQALVESLALFRPFHKLHVVFAAKESKSLHDVLRPIAPLADTITLTTFQLPGFGSHSIQKTAQVCAQLAPHITVYREPDPLRAVDQCIAAASPHDCIVITGSLYLAGFIRTRWIPESHILAHLSCF